MVIAITVIVFQRSRSRHELSEPPENSGFGRRLVSKQSVLNFESTLEKNFPGSSHNTS